MQAAVSDTYDSTELNKMDERELAGDELRFSAQYNFFIDHECKRHCVVTRRRLASNDYQYRHLLSRGDIIFSPIMETT
jgi:hypothetical protein